MKNNHINIIIQLKRIFVKLKENIGKSSKGEIL
jgi:hypothetical protein